MKIESKKYAVCLKEIGNTVSASIPIALAQSIKNEK
jgi:3-oxoacyl-[acyl-carrier-protein] synthase III